MNPDEKLMPVLTLYLFRHADRDGENISKKGAYEAIKLSKELFKNEEINIVFGSNRNRTWQTAIIMMYGEYVSPKEVATSEIVDPSVKFLDFYMQENSETTKLAIKSDAENNYFRWLVENSEEKSKENRDLHCNSTYLKNASQIAKLFIAIDKEQYNDVKGLAVTHKGVLESFLYAILSKKDRKTFLMKYGGGFDTLQGFRFEIYSKGKFKIMFKDGKIDIGFTKINLKKIIKEYEKYHAWEICIIDMI